MLAVCLCGTPVGESGGVYLTEFGVLGVFQSQIWWKGRVLAEHVLDSEVGDGEARVSGRASVKSRPHLEAFTVNGTEPFSAETDRIFHDWSLPGPNTGNYVG
jgi:hypothetical protein